VPQPLLVLVLVFILTIWNPASLALHAASAVSNVSARPGVTLAFVCVRIVITGTGVAAGIALWLRRPGAILLAKFALVLLILQTLVRFSAGIDLSGAPPGTRLPLATAIVAHNAGWYLYLHFSGRVRAAYGLESDGGSARL
jgi:hypothetical protein